MGAADRAAALRALADQVELESVLEGELRAARQAYRDDPSDETKTAHQQAAAALREARQQARSAGVTAASTEPGSVTLMPGAVAANGQVN